MMGRQLFYSGSTSSQQCNYKNKTTLFVEFSSRCYYIYKKENQKHYEYA